MATQIVLVQHGEKVRAAGDPGLTEIGHDQAEATAAWIVRTFGSDVAAVVSSPLRRARETAAPIAARLGLDVATDDRFRERMNWTVDSDLELDAFLAEWERASSDRTFLPVLGDSSMATGDRMLAALDELATTHSGRTVIVTSHGGATVDLLRTLLGDRAVDATLIAEGPSGCAITELAGTAGDWRVNSAADTRHLLERPGWWIDEMAHAGAEHLDAAYVAGYEAKAGFDPSVDLEILVANGLDAGATVVDLGAGTGVFSMAAAAQAGRVIAVDVSAAMIDVIRSKAADDHVGNVEVVQAGFLSYDHVGSKVDFVFSRNALHQLPDLWKAIALRRVHALLRPGGVFRLRDLVFDFEPDEAEARVAAWVEGAVDDPAKGFTADELEAHVRDEFSTWSWVLEPMLERVGFEILDVEYVRGAYGAYTCRRP